MKRIIFPSLLVLSVLSFLPNGPSSAQPMGQRMPPLAWAKLTDDIQVLRTWQLEGADVYPQVSLLRVSNTAYQNYFRDPQGFMKFVNMNKVFSKDVIIAGPWVSLSSFDAKDESPDWVLTMVHGKMSTMIVSALPQLKQEPPPKAK